ncbi:MAG: hypothetical protein MPJ05_07805 [Nitrosopumilus sp.]|nr:hypothetical protein [Nitrosopumilus sp.]
MNPKILVAAAVAAMAGMVALVTSIPSGQDAGAPAFEDITISLAGVEVERLSERAATISVSFEISNPNPGAVRVQVLDYQLYETEFGGAQLGGGQIGSRPGGLVEFGSDYYTLLGGGTLSLSDELVLRNTGDVPDLWERLAGDPSWRVTGDVFWNLSSVTIGQENELHFEFDG